jgi:hypothetical protein
MEAKKFAHRLLATSAVGCADGFIAVYFDLTEICGHADFGALSRF